MKATIDTFPVFEANQVLTNRHLNMLVEYLDEQQRLTRANLVGIGIVCGLETVVDGATHAVSISRGCAVTSQGYLIVEPEDLTLTRYREYTLPEGDAYAPFMNGAAQLSIWELFPDGEPDTTLLGDPAGFLTGKSVLLFVELDNENLSDCSPNNCDDKGSEVTVTVRRLLLRNADVAAMMALLNSETDESAALALPDLRLPRYDVPRTEPTRSQDVLEAFQNVIKGSGLVSGMQEALDACYAAFLPIVGDAYPANPFASFTTTYGFLESAPATTAQARFMQYYMDLFADMCAAYEELRDEAVEARCLCVPRDEYFPRHVALGPQHRTGWHPSPASCCDCEERRARVLLLFTRLVEIALRFTNNPPLPTQSRRSKVDTQVRITPSRFGDVPLSERALPYYYAFTGSPPLYRVWNPERTARKRANQNLAYRAFEYQPAPPAFVTEALSYDLEPYDFLRIEGHLGKNYRSVVSTLVALRDAHRLSFDVVALRTGAFTEDVDVDLSKYPCSFQDLEAMYDALRQELSCLTRKSLNTFGKLPLTRGNVKRTAEAAAAGTTAAAAGTTAAAAAAKTPGAKLDSAFFEELARENFATPNTLGFTFAERVRKNGFDDVALPGETPVINTAMNSMSLLVRFTAALADDLQDIDWDAFDAIWKRLKRMSEEIGLQTTPGSTEDMSWEELNRHIMAVVYACRIEGFISLRDEYRRRLLDIKRRQFFGEYLREHPALQHKAGVPVGGTFVIVYHEDDAEEAGLRLVNRASIVERSFAASAIPGASGNRGIAPDFLDRIESSTSLTDAYARAIDEMTNGTVIADFFLPTACSSDCPPMQFVIPPSPEPPAEPPTLAALIGCTSGAGVADVQLTVSGGTAPFLLAVDGAAAVALPASVALAAGSHALVLTDAEGRTGPALSVLVPPMLATSTPTYADDAAAATYHASFTITGGTAPYTVSSGTLSGGTVSAGPFPSGGASTIVVTDARNCSASVTLQHTVEPACKKPCEGVAVRRRYAAWAPRPVKGQPYAYQPLSAFAVQVLDASGTALFDRDLVREIGAILGGESSITDITYDAVMEKVCTEVSQLLAASLGPDHVIVSYQAADAGTLTIEHYACHSFSIRAAFTLVGQTLKRQETWTCTPDAVAVRQTSPGRGSYTMPAFGRIDLNKCLDTVGVDCRIAVKSITPAIVGNDMVLKADFAAPVDPATSSFFWRADTPALVTARTPELTLPLENTSTAQVQLLVVDKNNCWFFGEASITPNRSTPVRFIARPR